MRKLISSWSVRDAFKSGYRCAKNNMNKYANPFRNTVNDVEKHQAWEDGYKRGKLRCQ